jgi:DMSO/TMAO reductase YedYZ molybdopterin-dependent catalytic subunit
VPMTELLDEAGVKPGADMLLSTSEDGWTCGTPLAVITDGRNAMLALGMDGVPLPVEHGFPVRQVVPGLYGYVSATKWVTDWEITRFDEAEAYWTQRGWAALGPVKTQSRIDVPRGSVEAGVVPVAGIAWAQHTGITKVEVRVDDGEWEPAELARVPSDDTWVQWRWDWDARPGRHRLQVRATDKSGYTQTSERADVVPDGATGYHGVDISVA